VTAVRRAVRRGFRAVLEILGEPVEIESRVTWNHNDRGLNHNDRGLKITHTRKIARKPPQLVGFLTEPGCFAVGEGVVSCSLGRPPLVECSGALGDSPAAAIIRRAETALVHAGVPRS